MSYPKLQFNSGHFLILILILCLLYLGATTPLPSGSTASSQTDSLEKRRLDWERRKEQIRVEDLKVENKTKGVTLLSMDKFDNLLKLKLRNDYSKAVTAYVVAVGEMTIHTECLTGADYNDLFLPGTIREAHYGIQPNVDKLGIKILGVILEDGTDDGDRKFIKEMRQYRSGMKMQREKSIALLKNLVNSNAVDIQSELANIDDQVTSNEKQEDLPFFVKSGLKDEQYRFLRLIRRIKSMDNEATKNAQIKAENDLHSKKQLLIKVIENYTKTLGQL